MIVAYELIFGAALYVALSVFLQRKLANPKRMREIQEIIKQKSKELTELSKANADKDLLMSKQKELTPLLAESMKLQFKPMLVILPIFIVIYYIFLPMLFVHPGTLQFLSFKLSYQTYFIVYAVLLGFIASAVVMIYDRKKAKEEKAANAQTS